MKNQNLAEEILGLLNWSGLVQLGYWSAVEIDIGMNRIGMRSWCLGF